MSSMDFTPGTKKPAMPSAMRRRFVPAQLVSTITVSLYPFLKNVSPYSVKHRHGIKCTMSKNEWPQVSTEDHIPHPHSQTDKTDSN